MSSQIATFATIFFSMILVNNYVLVQFLGICPFLGVSKKLDSSAGMGAAVIVVMVIATAVTFPLQIFLLDAYNLGYLVAEFGFGLAYAEALVCAAGAGVGFLVAMLLFCGVRSRVEAANPPESFKGLPITLVSAAITSMSFMGFGGLVENIINAIF